MNAAVQTVLKSQTGEQIPLKAVSATGRLEGLLFELVVEQHYHNPSSTPIEAVFTFPLPLRAELLAFELMLGTRQLKAVATPKAAASRRYERAIDAGDAAVLLEHIGDGLYTVSLGNLLPGESAVIRYRYAELLEAHEAHLRLQIPSVIAPRYGNPADAGLSGPAIPQNNALVAYPFSITVEFPGLTDPRALSSPSHPLQISRTGTGLAVSLLRQGFLDRDFVLELAAASRPERALLSRDGEEWVVLASSALALPKAEGRSLALKVLLDCSGSMSGSSIEAARRALLAILDQLNPDDRIALTRFGSDVEQVTAGLEPADRSTLEPLQMRVRRIDADLGGTEMAQALRACLAIPTGEAGADILLITDGEIHAISEVVELAAQAGHRLFTIAIGAAPVEALARQLAQETRGGCEFVAPGEDVEGAILRTFKRLRSQPRTVAGVRWPGTPTWVAPLPAAVFPGDTLHLMAGFKERPVGGVEVTVRDARGHTQYITQALSSTEVEGDRIPRLAAARRISQLPEEAARELAVTYQLVSPYTSLIVVAEREAHEKAKQLPTVVPVPHMMTESVSFMAAACAAVDEEADVTGSWAVPESVDPAPAAVRLDFRSGPSTKVAFECSLRSPQEQEELWQEASGDQLLAYWRQRWQAGEPLPLSFADLADSGLPDQVLRELEMLGQTHQQSETTLVQAFLAVLADVLNAEQALLAALSGPVVWTRELRALRSELLVLVRSLIRG